MWCVVHVKDGNEAQTEAYVSGILPEGISARCFHLTRNRRKKLGGEWRTIHESLWPGYVFIDTQHPEQVQMHLKKAQKQDWDMESDGYPAMLAQEEEALMERIIDQDGCIAISKIQVRDDGQIEYLSGPILRVTDAVRKVNLHQRVAEIETSFLGRKQNLYMGIEIER